ncbi:tellurite resistance/C4-dicarboxylate transporter family protein [Pseudolysinimonas kribbensis]|uniref:Tellurite resistance protein permease n=2 Tax=Pseudolysinimonas kribbensis TaxID=433641 RepID=A0ABQ6K3X6_9MICO|nr:tellurite resistance/C4-dicarboxylate transporter family protein [Pseudolysinimonas kribbensis]GMA95153.1 tellurite resistance protein permease [Pseudolysinimonas kribbensis]
MPERRPSAWLATLAPGSFALVMATGIVSIGCRLLGHPVLALVLLVATAVGFVLLLAAYAARAALFPGRTLASITAPSSAVGYFTVVAAGNVLGTALAVHGLWLVALVLGVVAFLIWVVLTYGLLCSIVLAGNRPRLREITGTWLIWVVGTQSVAVLAAAIAPELPWPLGTELLEAGAVMFWSVGVVLYLVLVVIIFLRLFLIETTPREMGPTYWILMGATAISVRAAAGILTLPAHDRLGLVAEMHGFVAGLAVVLWAFGTWFIPALVLFGVWRHVIRRHSWGYEPGLWSVVFPLGMYAVASVTLGRAIHVRFLQDLAAVWVWVGVAAWLLVAALLVVVLVRRPRRRTEQGAITT